jgi:hypothetical protein
MLRDGEHAEAAAMAARIETHTNRRDLRDPRDLRPRGMIDIQAFMWVQGSDEYD